MCVCVCGGGGGGEEGGREEYQGVVTCMSPVEAFATVIKIFDRQKVCLIVPF